MRVEDKFKQDIIIGKDNPKVNILVRLLIDASGSMNESGKYEAARAGVNEEIKTLRKDDTANYDLAVEEFTSGYTGYLTINRIKIPLNSTYTFHGKGADGGTPLYQAAAQLINNTVDEAKRGDRILIKIYTDGGENTSKQGWGREEGGAKRLNDLIEKVKRENNVTVVFVGTEFDVESMIKNVGISRGNTYVHLNTGTSVGQAMHMSSVNTMSYAKDMARGAMTVDSFFGKSIEGEDKTQESKVAKVKTAKPRKTKV